MSFFSPPLTEVSGPQDSEDEEEVTPKVVHAATQRVVVRIISGSLSNADDIENPTDQHCLGRRRGRSMFLF